VRNFLKENYNRAIFELKPPERPEKVEIDYKKFNPNFGRVPSYLIKDKHRKLQMEKDRAIEEAKAKRPSGTRLIDEDERADTLQQLIEAKDVATRALEKLPMFMYSGKTERTKRELEEQVIQLHRAIDTMSRRDVYAPITHESQL
jgi:hypothetical protein